MDTKNLIQQYDGDMYLRISREDGDKVESDSIANQRDLISAFLEKHSEITLRKVWVDDGYTGVNFDRPDFIRMMESVKNKKTNCIIVKDFSRLGRNFIKTGKYIEKIFPFMGVRFISVNDDSGRNGRSSGGQRCSDLAGIGENQTGERRKCPGNH